MHALELRVPTAEVVTSYFERPDGSQSKLSTYKDGLRILYTMARLFRDVRPLPFFFGIAALFAAAGLGLGAEVIAEFLETRLVPRLPTAVLATGLMLLASLSIACGMILDSVARGTARGQAPRIPCCGRGDLTVTPMPLRSLLLTVLCVLHDRGRPAHVQVGGGAMEVRRLIVERARRGFLSPLMIAALALYAVATVLWVYVLRTVPLSAAYAVFAFAFIIVPVLAHFVLDEPLSAERARRRRHHRGRHPRRRSPLTLARGAAAPRDRGGRAVLPRQRAGDGRAAPHRPGSRRASSWSTTRVPSAPATS